MHYYTKVELNIWFYSSLLKKEKNKKTTSVNNSLCAQPFVDRVGRFCSMARCIFSFLESLNFEFTELLSWKAVKSARIDLSIVTCKFWQILTYTQKTSNILGTNPPPMLLFTEWYKPTKIPCERKTMGKKTGYKNVRQFAAFTLIYHETPCLPPQKFCLTIVSNFLFGFTILPRELLSNQCQSY